MSLPDHLLPPNEEARLHALRAVDLPAALKEPLFQHLVDLAAQIFHLPISFLSVVEAGRVDFAVTHGIAPLLGAPREETLCSLPVRQASTFVIEDINADQAGEASVHRGVADSLGMVFYAGSPLLVADEVAIGALCISDRRSRHFSRDEQQVLESLAALLSRALVLWQSLRLAASHAQWHHLQEVILQEVNSLEALLRYLNGRPGQDHTTTPLTLRMVERRLVDITELLLANHS